MKSEGLSESEKLQMQIELTIQFAFGSMCDKVADLVEDPAIVKLLQSRIRNQGNDAIRVINNHLQHVRITRRHSRDSINAGRVLHSHLQGDLHGD